MGSEAAGVGSGADSLQTAFRAPQASLTDPGSTIAFLGGNPVRRGSEDRSRRSNVSGKAQIEICGPGTPFELKPVPHFGQKGEISPKSKLDFSLGVRAEPGFFAGDLVHLPGPTLARNRELWRRRVRPGRTPT